MGRGDKKSKKGKITLGSYGNSRRRNAIKARMKRAASRKVAEPSGAGEDTPAKSRRTVKKKSEG